MKIQLPTRPRIREFFPWLLGGLTLLWSFQAFGQSDINTFGQNKVQYKDFQWKVYKTKHFDVYFYQGMDSLVRRAGILAESASDSLSRDLKHSLSRRYPILLYSSHGDFEQTNVTLDLIEQSVGGFTEQYKDRVVVPFEGGNEAFRHVLHHELTHLYQFDILYGGTLANLLSHGYMLEMPLWFAEGMAEFYSNPWDGDAEMTIRDAVVHERLIPIQNLDYSGGYILYKEGQSFFLFLAHRYGREKVGELLRLLKVHRDIDKAIQSATGSSLENLNEEWTRSLKKRYWPLVAEKSEPGEVAKALTDHRREGSYFNVSPVLSPDGGEFVFFSDRGLYTDVYLGSALDGRIIKRLVKGERSSGFESFHSLRKDFTWSPDGIRVAFVAKSATRDRLYFLNVLTGKVEGYYQFDMDALFTPTWSPDGRDIVVSGLKDGDEDLYRIDVSNGKISRLTSGPADDKDPTWSPDGKLLAFASDRPSGTDSSLNYGLFLLVPDSGTIRTISVPKAKALGNPTWSPDGKQILFSSDYNGVSNLFVTDLADTIPGKMKQVTDVIGGAASPSWAKDGKRLLFAGYEYYGWDVFVLKDPETKIAQARWVQINRPASQAGSTPTGVGMESSGSPASARRDSSKSFIREGGILGDTSNALAIKGTPKAVGHDSSEGMGRDSLLLAKFAKDTTTLMTAPKDSSKVQRDTITGKIEKPGLDMSADWVSGAVGYSTLYGLQGQTEIALSDILGNHRIYILTDLVSSVDNSNFNFTYLYLPKRFDYGFTLYQEKNYYLTTAGDVFGEKVYGAGVLARYPFSRFKRLDFEVDGIGFNRDLYDDYGDVVETRRYSMLVPSLSLVHDNAYWGLTGPVSGSRWLLTVRRSVNMARNSLSFATGMVDYRHYLRFAKRYAFAYRMIGVSSIGRDAQAFALGGSQTLRGYHDYDFIGSNAAVMNLELRYPLIDRLDFGLPLPIFLGQIRGVMFFDLGAAWDRTREFQFFESPEGTWRLKDAKAGFGLGARAQLSFLVLRLDVAKATDFSSTSKETPVYFSVGSDW